MALELVCSQCDSVMSLETEICGVCFASVEPNVKVLKLGATSTNKVMKDMQFITADFTPKNMNQPNNLTEAEEKKWDLFRRMIATAPLMSLLRYRKTYIAGIAVVRHDNTSGLFFQYVAIAGLPEELKLFLFFLALRMCVQNQVEKVFIPPKLFKSVVAFCESSLDLTLTPEATPTKKASFKKLRLRNEMKQMCDESYEILAERFTVWLNSGKAQIFEARIEHIQA